MCAHSIRDLISKVPDVNTGNRYRVEIFLPDALKVWNGHLDKIQFYCKECTLPGTTLTQIENRVYGQKRLLGSFKEAGTTSTAFIFDYKGLNVKLFNAWHDYIIKPDVKRLEYYTNYIGRVRISLLNNINKPIYICNLEEAYPVKINELALGYGQNELLPLEIEWCFRTKSYVEIFNEETIIESAVKDGTTSVIGDLINGAISIQDKVSEVATEVLSTVNDINNAADRIRTIGRIFDIYTK